MPESTPITPDNFRSLIAGARRDRGFTKSDFAKRLHCSTTYVSAIEAPKSASFPSPRVCHLLALNLDLDETALKLAVATAQTAYAAQRALERAQRHIQRRAARYQIDPSV